MAIDETFTGSFDLSGRLSVEITVSPLGMICEWDPDLPESLTQEEIDAYRAARAEMLAKVVKAGAEIVVVET